MPVFLDEVTRKVWLDPLIDFRSCVDKISNSDIIDGNTLNFVRVSDQVNSIRNQGLQCILPKPEFDKLQHAKGLGRFFKPAVPKQEETKEGLKEHIKEMRAEESKRIEAVVSTAAMYGTKKKDTLD